MNPNKPEISGDEWLLFLLLMAMNPLPVKTQEELERDEIIADYYREQEFGKLGHGDIDE